MRRNRRERGEGQIGCIIGVIFLLLAIFIAYKFIPVKVKAADLGQTVVDEARSAGTHDDDRIIKNIVSKAEELGLPVTEEDVEINRNRTFIKVDVTYVVLVELPGYTYEWNFHHHAENPIF